MGLRVWVLGALVVTPCLLVPIIGRAQMPRLPVLQNGFVTSGWSVGLNAGGTSSDGVLAAAGAWSPTSGVMQVSAGVGADFGTGAGFAYGARIGAPLTFLERRGPIGAIAFIGIGGNSAVRDTSRLEVPVGIGVGYRHTLGATRGISVYAAPFYLYQRTASAVGSATNQGSFRASLGTDLTVSPRLGLTLGGDAGTRGPGRIAAGVSYLLIH